MSVYEPATDKPDWNALTSRLGLVRGPIEEARVEFLDTFDWRVWKAGYTLSMEWIDSDCFLVLRDLEGQGLARRAVAETPVFSDDLPGGRQWKPARKALDVRALQVVANCERQVESWERCDELGKVTARVLLQKDEVGDETVDDLLRVESIRGYGPFHDELVGELSEESDWAPASRSALERVCDAHGRHPGDTIVELPELTGNISTGVAIKRILRSFLQAMQQCEEGLMEDTDSEFLHDFRVAVRRTRSMLNRFKKVMPHATENFAEEFRWLGAVTSPQRDLDVYLLEFDHYESLVHPAVRDDLAPLRSYLVTERTLAFLAVQRALQSERYRNLITAWALYLEGEDVSSESKMATKRARKVVSERIWTTYQATLKEGHAIHEGSPAEALHDMRKTCKKLRYLLEAFSGLFEREVMMQLIKQLKKLQNVLGDFQDLEVHVTTLRSYGFAMADKGLANPAVLMAMGELMGRLEDQRLETRTRFADAFEHFAGVEVATMAASQFEPKKPKKKSPKQKQKSPKQKKARSKGAEQ